MTRSAEKKMTSRFQGFRTKLFLYFALFTVIALLVITVFQTVFLGSFYRSSIRRETAAAAETVAEGDIHSENFESDLYSVAAKRKVCISLYRVGSWDEPLYTAHTQSMCMIHQIRESAKISEVYKSVKQNGSYSETYTDKNDSTAGEYLYALTFSDAKSDYLVIANSDIAPVDATVTTLRRQLIVISVLLLATSAVMAVIISRRFAKPIEAMSEEAKKLAVGNYNVNFTGGGIKETTELADTLNYASHELSQLDTMQKELISNISHDLRTPLTLISGYSEVMRDIPGEMSPENMQIIIDETERLSSLVSDMLDLSRITGGKRELKLSVFSLTEAVRKTVDRYAHLSAKDGYDISFNAPEEIYTEGDETLILQVIYNLVSNAINYTGDDKKVYIEQNTYNGICRISVSDTGDGIPEEKLPLIWDRYYRTGDYHKRAVTGTGLGLSIVKNALILHGANFGVASTPGVGSTFWFEMKIHKDS